MATGSFVLVGRLALAALFLAAGAGKLADPGGSRRAVADFGVPARLAPTIGLLLPLAELAVAVALIPVGSAPGAAVAAAALLLAFTGAIANAMAHGREPDCHCFGQIHSSPAGWSTLARNLALLAVAGFVAIAGPANPGPSATRWLDHLSAAALIGAGAGTIGLALVGFVLWFALQLLAQNGRIAGRLDGLERSIAQLAGTPLADAGAGGFPRAQPPPSDLVTGLGEGGLPVGSDAPEFELPGSDGGRHTLGSLLALRRPALLIFTDAGCGPCSELMPEVAVWQAEHEARLTVAMIAAGDPARNQAKAREHGLGHFLQQADRDVSERYLAAATPAAVLVSAGGRIESPLVGGAEGIRALMARAVARSLPIRHVAGSAVAAGTAPPADPAGPAPPSALGTSAPDLELPDLDGVSVALSDLYTRRTLALFWNPDCGFCERMLPDLQRFEARARPEQDPQIVVFTTGGIDDNRAQGLRSLMLLDREGVAQRAFGAAGTPMAVLIEAGRIVSPVVAGADAVLALAVGSTDVA